MWKYIYKQGCTTAHCIFCVVCLFDACTHASNPALAQTWAGCCLLSTAYVPAMLACKIKKNACPCVCLSVCMYVGRRRDLQGCEFCDVGNRCNFCCWCKKWFKIALSKNIDHKGLSVLAFYFVKNVRRWYPQRFPVSATWKFLCFSVPLNANTD